MALKEYAGAAPATRLAGSLASGTTTNFAVITSGGAGYPTGSTAPFVVVIDRGTASEEKILVTTRSGDTFSTLTRGYDGTSAQAHNAQAVVEHVYDAASATEASAHTNTTTRDDHTQYLKTDGSRAFTGMTQIATGLPTTSAPGDAAAVGTGNDLAKSTHRHAREAAWVAWTGHTFAVAGEVFVQASEVDYIIPLFVPVHASRTVKLVKARYRINAGTSATVKLQKNGVDITGFTGISVTTTAATTDPADVALVDNDLIALIVTAVSGNPKNMTFTIVLEHA